MSLPEIVATVNAILAFIAFLGIQWSIPKVGKPINTILAICSAFALFYCGSYVWLAFNIEQAVGWSALMRFISWGVWPFVWTLPAMTMAVYVKKSTALVQALTQELKNKVEEDRIEYH